MFLQYSDEVEYCNRHDRPGPACHQSHRPSNWAFVVQPGSIRVPPLAHDGGDVRGGQSSLPRRSGFVRQPVGTSCGGLCGMLPGGSEVISSDATVTISSESQQNKGDTTRHEQSIS